MHWVCFVWRIHTICYVCCSRIKSNCKIAQWETNKTSIEINRSIKCSSTFFHISWVCGMDCIDLNLNASISTLVELKGGQMDISFITLWMGRKRRRKRKHRCIYTKFTWKKVVRFKLSGITRATAIRAHIKHSVKGMKRKEAPSAAIYLLLLLLSNA